MQKIIIVIFLISLTCTHEVYASEWQTYDLDGRYFTSIEKTDFGLVLGEYDPRTSADSYNGVYITKNFGEAWTYIGLADHGVTDLDYKNGKTYAGVYYWYYNNSGVFEYKSDTNIWVPLGLRYAVNEVTSDDTYVYAGTYGHGLWKRAKNNPVWNQCIGGGEFGPTITSLVIDRNNTILVGTDLGAYISTDIGATWQLIEQLGTKNISHIVLTDSGAVIGTFTNDGIYISNKTYDQWEKSQNFGSYSVGGLLYALNCVFAGKTSPNGYEVFKSCDLGNTWSSVGLVSLNKSTRINAINYVTSDKHTLIAIVNGEGVKNRNLETLPVDNPIFERPWNNTEHLMVDYITAFFDHEYPFLGSSYIESEGINDTTVNFLGLREKQPLLYYSSHNGTDFALPLNTPILAADAGVASFSYCVPCGNTISIDHGNGYLTQYMHLQPNDLITTSNPVWVNKGQQIGKVGLTGKTSGPHLHFTVITDSNHNNIFGDEYPYGMSDPFGWKNINYSDPWPEYVFETPGGYKAGANSNYLWLEQLEEQNEIMKNEGSTVVSNNVVVTYEASTTTTPSTIFLLPYIKPNEYTIPYGYEYIPGTSLLITIMDHFGQNILSVLKPFRIAYDLQQTEINSIEDAKIFAWNKLLETWEPLVTYNDVNTEYLWAFSDDLTRFTALVQDQTGIELEVWGKAPTIKKVLFSIAQTL